MYDVIMNTGKGLLWKAVFTLFVALVLASSAALALARHDIPMQTMGILFQSAVNGQRGLYWMAADGSDVTQVVRFADVERGDYYPIVSASLSPDGTLLAYTEQTYQSASDTFYDYALYDLTRRQIVDGISGDGRAVLSFAWSPDSSIIAYMDGFRGLGRMVRFQRVDGRESATAQVERATLRENAVFRWLDWSSDGQQVVVSFAERLGTRASNNLLLVGQDGASSHSLLAASSPAISSPSWMPGTGIVYYVCTGESRAMTAICALDIPTSKRVVIRDVAAFLPPDAELWYLDVAASGDLLFMHNLLRTEQNAIYVLDAETGSVTIPTGQANAWSVPRWAAPPSGLDEAQVVAEQ